MTLFLILWLGCAVLCWIVANSKGRFAGVWFLLGLMLGPFALFAVAVLPSVLPDKNAPSPKTHVKCPDCREFVLKYASVCRHCRCKLVPQ
jgi:cytochrome bd-type quinol oxidase subunit 2